MSGLVGNAVLLNDPGVFFPKHVQIWGRSWAQAGLSLAVGGETSGGQKEPLTPAAGRALGPHLVFSLWMMTGTPGPEGKAGAKVSGCAPRRPPGSAHRD